MGFMHRLSNFATRQLPVKPTRLNLTRALASFTFDDFPKSAWEVGGPLLDQYGVKATFYAVGSYCGNTVDGVEQYDEADLKAVHAAGHEIGCHTFSHQQGPRVSSVMLNDDIAHNALFLAEVLGDVRPSSFAYPYGEVNPRTKFLFGDAFPTSRGIRPGLNGKVSDLAQLKAVPIEARSWKASDIERWVAAAKETDSWLVFFSHDVSETPTPYGCTPQMLEHALRCVADAGIETLPVKHALAAAAFG